MSEADMLCDNAIQLLPLQNEDDFLSADERQGLEAHLSDCAACRQVANGYLADRTALSQVASGQEAGPAPALLDGFAASVMERLGRESSAADAGELEVAGDLLAPDRWEAPVVASASNIASPQPARPASSGWRTSSVVAAAAVVALVWLLDRPRPVDPTQTSHSSDPAVGQSAQEHDLAQDLTPRRIRVIRFDDQAPRKHFFGGEAVKFQSVRQGGNGNAPEGARPRPVRLEFGVERAGPSDTAWGL